MGGHRICIWAIYKWNQFTAIHRVAKILLWKESHKLFYFRANNLTTSLENIITSDENLANFKSRLLQILSENFMMASEYMQQYSQIKNNYLASMSINQEHVSNETGWN